MFFTPLIDRWGLAALAGDLGLPTKNVRRWADFDAIPADWFAPVVRAAIARGFDDVTHELLASRAEARRLHMAAQAKAASRGEAA